MPTRRDRARLLRDVTQAAHLLALLHPTRVPAPPPRPIPDPDGDLLTAAVLTQATHLAIQPDERRRNADG
ncbi:hypothetical protein [Kitasatospora sp. A2-31]|uniref:hypothetical protein n=1 Tax=Kitasatospora sp. A2-31 TaxID=2916414 RepID=UPI001EEACCBB|nr:hypothetical protein [Kitasatospora sp. A2-31]MCG6496631.1 hypothetical protein [Kitasatospora sp. A2-31]